MWHWNKKTGWSWGRYASKHDADNILGWDWSSKYHICPRSFASWPTVLFSDHFSSSVDIPAARRGIFTKYLAYQRDGGLTIVPCCNVLINIPELWNTCGSPTEPNIALLTSSWITFSHYRPYGLTTCIFKWPNSSKWLLFNARRNNFF